MPESPPKEWMDYCMAAGGPAEKAGADDRGAFCAAQWRDQLTDETRAQYMEQARKREATEGNPGGGFCIPGDAGDWPP